MSLFAALQQFITNSALSMFSLLKIALSSSFFLKPPKVVNNQKACILLGNGPSLNKTLEKDLDKLLSNDLMCVNQFANTSQYEQLKPKYYVMQAESFLVEKAINDHYERERTLLFNNIANKTNWDCILFLPFFAKKSTFWKMIIKDNKHVQVCYYNPTPVEGIKSLNHWLFKMNLGMPRPHNVLIPGIMEAINMGYKNIYLTGADHSWHEQFLVDENNNFKMTDTHFFTVQNEPVVRLSNKGSQYHIHDVFRKFYLSFKGYHEIKSYAEKEKVNIYNASYKSYIDAFERKAL